MTDCVEDRLLPQHLADLRRSGLADPQILACGFHSAIDPVAVGRALGWTNPARTTVLGPCLAIPFPAPDGQPTGYTRFRPDNPRTDRKRGGKPIRYESPVGVPNRAYLPPLTRSVLTDPSAPLLLSEGEKKAARADQDGFPCIGLVGVYGWQAKRAKGPDGKATGPREMIPDLAAVAWAGRRIYLAYDSDLADKPAVLWAEWHLAEVLTRLGAEVLAVRLPAGAGGAKVGLDDFLVTDGPDTLRELLNQARPPVRPGRSEEPQPNDAPDNPHRLAAGFLHVVSPGVRPACYGSGAASSSAGSPGPTEPCPTPTCGPT